MWMQTMDRLEPVDVILAAWTPDLCDPLELSGSSTFGVPGLLQAARRGDVAVVNGLGLGCAGAPRPGRLPAEGRSRPPRRGPGLLPSLEPGGAATTSGATTSSPTWSASSCAPRWPVPRAVRARLGAVGGAARPRPAPHRGGAHAWVGQEASDPSADADLVDDRLEDRPAWIRAFASPGGASTRCISGGLARSTPCWPSPARRRPDVVAKDVWVVTVERYEPSEPFASDLLASTASGCSPASPRIAEDLFWFGRYAERAQGTARLAPGRGRPAQRPPAVDRAERPAMLAALDRIVTTVVDGWPPAGCRHATAGRTGAARRHRPVRGRPVPRRRRRGHRAGA